MSEETMACLSAYSYQDYVREWQWLFGHRATLGQRALWLGEDHQFGITIRFLSADDFEFGKFCLAVADDEMQAAAWEMRLLL